jgi:serine/threonine-protein kinase
VLASHIAAEADSRVRFEREARMAARVSDHPNVATIYDVGEHGSVPFIVMELYTAGSVADRLRGPSRVPRSQAISWLETPPPRWTTRTARASCTATSSPRTSCSTSAGRSAVADFGIARSVDDSSLTQAGQVLGTAAYLSPEQALGRAATAASDRYALGIVAFELLTGKRPFGGEHIAAQARQHVEAEPPDSALGAEADEVLHRGMAKDPDERYLTAGRFAEELKHAVQRAGGPPTEATRAVTRARPLTPMPNAPAPAPAAARAAPVAAAPPTATSADLGYARQSGGNRRGVMALAALAALAAAALIALIAGGGGDGENTASNTGTTDEPARTQPEKKNQDTQAAAPAEEPPAESTPPAATQDNEPEDGPGPSTSGESPRALNDKGYALLQGGDAAGAVAPLEAAVKGYEEQGDAADPTNYGYALYNLGMAYLGSGRPAEAIPLFERRLQVNPSDRPEVVRGSIADAQAQLGGKKPKKNKE